MKNKEILKTLGMDIMLSLIFGFAFGVGYAMYVLMTDGFQVFNVLFETSHPVFPLIPTIVASLVGLFITAFCVYHYLAPHIKKNPVLNLVAYTALVLLFGLVAYIFDYGSGYVWIDAAGSILLPIFIGGGYLLYSIRHKEN